MNLRDVLLIAFAASCTIFQYIIVLLNYQDLFLCYILKEVEETPKAYDYIIVGAGSAGSVVAHRLGEDLDSNILLLEAGPYIGSFIDIPGIAPLLHTSKISWQYETVPQKHSCYGLHSNKSKWPFGKVVGGTSRLNNMIYARGHPNDFHGWYKDVASFDYEQDILGYFKKAEFQQGSYVSNSKHHSAVKGPLEISDLPYTTIGDKILEAAKHLGYIVGDLNADEPIGFMKPQVNLVQGRRSSTFHYLYQNKNRNVKLQTHSQVVKVLFKSNFEASAVIYYHLGKYFKARAKKGIILSAGVVETPKILMLSGIGDKSHLDKMNIDCMNDLPVGLNLQDHVTTGIDLVTINSNANLQLDSLISPLAAYKYYCHSTGPWTSSGCEVLAVLNVTTPNPDLGLMVIPTGLTADNGLVLHKNIGINDETWHGYFSNLIGKNSTISILPIVLHPKSKGTVRLKSKDPFSQPLIDPNYLAEMDDVNVLLDGIRLIERILETEPIKSVGAALNPNKIHGCSHLEFRSNEYWECYVRRLTITAYHPVGTCKMGANSDKSSVTNYDFQVLNTNHLYVVDASVLPTLTSANINAAVIMMAEKAADTIKFHEYLFTHKCCKMEIFLRAEFCAI